MRLRPVRFRSSPLSFASIAKWQGARLQSADRGFDSLSTLVASVRGRDPSFRSSVSWFESSRRRSRARDPDRSGRVRIPLRARLPATNAVDFRVERIMMLRVFDAESRRSDPTRNLENSSVRTLGFLRRSRLLAFRAPRRRSPWNGISLRRKHSSWLRHSGARDFLACPAEQSQHACGNSSAG